MDILPNIILVVTAIVPLVTALTIHEVAKAWASKKLGDRYTIKSYNMFDYIDNIGTLAMPLAFILLTGSLALFGWAKPAHINSEQIRSRKDRVILYLSGSIANLLMILGWFLLAIIVSIGQVKFTGSLVELPLWDMLLKVSMVGISLNTLIIGFSLFPLLPYDGGKIVQEFLPLKAAIKFKQIEPYSMYIMLFLVFLTPVMRIYVAFMDSFINYAMLTPILNLIR